MSLAKKILTHREEIEQTAKECGVQVIIEVDKEENQFMEALEIFPEL